jgi:hypothetical protein
MQGTAMNWTELEIQSVWEKAEVVEHYNPRQWRKDCCGAWMARNQFGNHNSRFGWEIDLLTPADKGGTRDLSNLQPFQWKNAASRQDGRSPGPVRAYGGDNIDFG